jgi:hypothetical protein
VIIEHIEYLHTEAAKGKKTTLFCAPQIQRGLKLVVPQSINSLDNLKGKTMAVRDLGRPHRITLWLRKVGLENSVKTIIVPDKEVGRWQQWRKIVSGECVACFRRRSICPPRWPPDSKPSPPVKLRSSVYSPSLSVRVRQKQLDADKGLPESRDPRPCIADLPTRRSDGDHRPGNQCA